MIRLVARLVFLMALVTRTCFAQQIDFQDNDRVCFLGNSITMAGGFHHDIALAYALRYPEKKIRFFNCGISGDVATGMLKRLQSDVLINNPTWCIIKAGMNDVNGSLYDKRSIGKSDLKELREAALEAYYKNMEQLIKALLDHHIKVVLQKPSIFDQTAKMLTDNNAIGKNEALAQCGIYVQQLANKYHLPVVDYYSILLRINKEVQAKDSTATIIGADRTHPGPYGHFIMGYQFLKTANFSPLVSQLTVDVNDNKKSEGVNCSIQKQAISKNELILTYTENSLPYPRLYNGFKPDSLVSFTKDINNEILKIKGLVTGRYKLTIDDVAVGTYTQDVLSDGINLANNESTPQYKQAKLVEETYNKCWAAESKLRNIKYVEYGRLNDFAKKNGLNDMNAIQNYFNGLIEEYKRDKSPFTEVYKKSYDDYMINKPNEQKYAEQFNSTWAEIYRLNQPATHTIHLLKEI